MLSLGESYLKIPCRIYKCLNLFCNSLHVLLVLASFVVRDAVDSEINRSFQFLFRPIATLWWIWVRIPRLQFTLGFPRLAQILGARMNPWWSERLLLGRSRGVSCLANNYLLPLSLTTFTTHSLGTDWYVIMALERVCQNPRSASWAEDKWIQYTASCSSLQWIWQWTFLGSLKSVIDSASSASLSNGSRGVKKIVCLPSLRSFRFATSPASAMEYWFRARPHVVDELFPFARNHHISHQSWWDNYSTWVTLNRTNISEFTIFIFTDFKHCLEAPKIKAMESIFVCAFFFVDFGISLSILEV